MLIVEPERHPAVRSPVELEDRQPFTLQRVEHREVPRQHVAAQSRLASTSAFRNSQRGSGRPSFAPPGTRRIRLSMSHPRMKNERCALARAARTAVKYSSPSTRNATRVARSIRQQLRPGAKIDGLQVGAHRRDHRFGLADADVLAASAATRSPVRHWRIRWIHGRSGATRLED
jgi:hypothetical protein